MINEAVMLLRNQLSVSWQRYTEILYYDPPACPIETYHYFDHGH